MNRLERYVAEHNPEMDDDVIKAMRKRRRYVTNAAEQAQHNFFRAAWRGMLVTNRHRDYMGYRTALAKVRFDSKCFLYDMSGYRRWDAYLTLRDVLSKYVGQPLTNEIRAEIVNYAGDAMFEKLWQHWRDDERDAR